MNADMTLPVDRRARRIKAIIQRQKFRAHSQFADFLARLFDKPVETLRIQQVLEPGLFAVRPIPMIHKHPQHGLAHM